MPTPSAAGQRGTAEPRSWGRRAVCGCGYMYLHMRPPLEVGSRPSSKHCLRPTPDHLCPTLPLGRKLGSCLLRGRSRQCSGCLWRRLSPFLTSPGASGYYSPPQSKRTHSTVSRPWGRGYLVHIPLHGSVVALPPPVTLCFLGLPARAFPCFLWTVTGSGAQASGCLLQVSELSPTRPDPLGGLQGPRRLRIPHPELLPLHSGCPD